MIRPYFRLFIEELSPRLLMAKRPNPVPTDEIDTSNTDPKYWEEILRREGLSMSRGLHQRVNYAGSARDLHDLLHATAEEREIILRDEESLPQ